MINPKHPLIITIVLPVVFIVWSAGKADIFFTTKFATQPPTKLPTNTQPIISAERGHKIAQIKGCFNCHSVDGSKRAGPTWKNLYGHKTKLENDTTIIADSSYIAQSIKTPDVKVVKGYSSVMSKFSDLSPSKIASLIMYIKSLSNTKPENQKGTN